MRFTAEQAFEADQDGDPIMMEEAAARRIFNDHDTGESWSDYLAEAGEDPLNAATLLAWLGY